MKRPAPLPLLLAAFHALAGCAQFQDRPLDPSVSAAHVEARSLAGAGLREFIGNLLGHGTVWPPHTWSLDLLTLAAIYYHPDLALARAQAETADAAGITAAQRPNPSITLTPTWVRNLATAAVPWIAASSISIPIETAGKRGFRMDRAAHLADAARLRVADAAWQVRSRLRQALLEAYAAGEAERLLQRQLAFQDAMTQRLERQLKVGEIARPEMLRSQLALNQMRLNVSAAQKRQAESRVTLASAIGVPADALEGIALDFAHLSQPPAVGELSLPKLRETALRERPDVLAALADYAAAQSAVQLEIANQYPNVQANPGYIWELGEHRWVLGAMVGLPILNQNQGPIAEAEARRREAAMRFEALQTRILGDIDRARAGLEAVLAKWRDAERLLAIQQDHLRSVQTLFQAGETDRLALLGAELEQAAAERARLDVLVETQQAVNALEDTLRYPVASALSPGDIADSAATKGDQ